MKNSKHYFSNILFLAHFPYKYLKNAVIVDTLTVCNFFSSILKWATQIFFGQNDKLDIRTRTFYCQTWSEIGWSLKLTEIRKFNSVYKIFFDGFHDLWQMSRFLTHVMFLTDFMIFNIVIYLATHENALKKVYSMHFISHFNQIYNPLVPFSSLHKNPIFFVQSNVYTYFYIKTIKKHLWCIHFYLNLNRQFFYCLSKKKLFTLRSYL